MLISPFSNPDHAEPLNWRASNAVGGSPGGSDALDYASWKTTNGNPADGADTDGDGFNTRVEYVLGGNPLVSEPGLKPGVVLEAGNSLLLSIKRRADVGDVNLIPQSTTDLGIWQNVAPSCFISNVRLPGTPAMELLTFRIPNPSGATRHFVRFAFQ